MSVTAHASRTISAPKEVVWSVLDDFPRISAWSAGIQRSYTTGDADLVTGLGAATFSVRDNGDGTTEAIIDAAAVPKLPGLLVRLMAPVLSKGIAKNFGGLLDELATEAEQQHRATKI